MGLRNGCLFFLIFMTCILKIDYIFRLTSISLASLDSCHIQALELQKNIENAGGERLKSQKSKVEKIQSVSISYTEKLKMIMRSCLY